MKTHDLAVKVGEYQKGNETKGRYLNIGAVMEGQNGPYLLINKTFNPAGIQDGKESILVSMFPVDNQKKQNDGFDF
ncbi:hypothetical protein [Bdellovibrio sp. HCB288]|uniref:hypothetical protein n=1 Tax=Bdellovibrio sp. HCB288 TaxID=3394355 RepID=UPI0039B6DED4